MTSNGNSHLITFFASFPFRYNQIIVIIILFWWSEKIDPEPEFCGLLASRNFPRLDHNTIAKLLVMPRGIPPIFQK